MGVKTQSYIKQISRERSDGVSVVKVESNKGVKIDDWNRLGALLNIGAIIFSIGIIGIFLNRKNIIVILMSIELILLAVNINLVSFSIFLGDLTGQVFTLFILTVAAAEAAIGLAIIVVYYRNSGTIRVEHIDELKG